MKTLVLILSKIRKGDNSKSLLAVKEEIIRYVGLRMIDSENELADDVPAIVLNQTISREDKEFISTCAKDEEAFVFIEGAEEQFDGCSPKYLDCVIAE